MKFTIVPPSMKSSALALLVLSALPAQASLVLLSQGSFDKFEPDNVEIPEVQLNWFLHLDDMGNDLVLTVRNDGTEAVVTDLFVEDLEGILSNAEVVDLPGVDYEVQANGNLPGGNNIDFTETFVFSPNPSPIQNGIAAGEEAQFRFEWNMEEADVRFAAHVQSIGSQDLSASYVSHTAIPEPSSALLLSFAGIGLACRRRR